MLQLTVPDSPEHRESALLELSKKREAFADLAPILWHSFGTMGTLLQEIVAIYPTLSPPNLTAHASNRVCNALALLQCVASHPETRGLFLAAHVPLYLYPFLNTVSKNRPFEYLRLTSLGVVGALVKMDDSDVINFLLQTEIIPLCLRIMETGSELSKTVATFIVQKVLLDDVGLTYVCATAERFYAVATVLANMVQALAEQPSIRLLKHIVRCYLRLSDNLRAREALRQCLPDALREGLEVSLAHLRGLATERVARVLVVGRDVASIAVGAIASVGGGRAPILSVLLPPVEEVAELGAHELGIVLLLLLLADLQVRVDEAAVALVRHALRRLALLLAARLGWHRSRRCPPTTTKITPIPMGR